MASQTVRVGRSVCMQALMFSRFRAAPLAPDSRFAQLCACTHVRQRILPTFKTRPIRQPSYNIGQKKYEFSPAKVGLKRLLRRCLLLLNLYINFVSEMTVERQLFCSVNFTRCK